MGTGQSEQSTSVWAAMERVLSAEQDARQQLEASRAEAQRILADAGDAEQRVRDTTRRRIERVHDLCQRATAARIRAMRREAARKMAVFDYEPGRADAVSRAAAALARRLTSCDGEHD